MDISRGVDINTNPHPHLKINLNDFLPKKKYSLPLTSYVTEKTLSCFIMIK